MKSWTIVGYMFQADIYDTDCIVEVVGDTYPLFHPDNLIPTIPTYDAERYLSFVARQMGIDRMDEHTFDSDDFPKVIFADSVEDDTEVCGKCHEALID